MKVKFIKNINVKAFFKFSIFLKMSLIFFLSFHSIIQEEYQDLKSMSKAVMSIHPPGPKKKKKNTSLQIAK